MSKREERIKKVIASISHNLNELAEILLSVEPQENEQKKKRPRDPNAPKQPPSNFFLFTNSIREQVDKENPNASFVEKSKIYGARWQKLTEEEKKPFTEEAKKEREKYLKQLVAYEKAHPELAQHHPEKKAKTSNKTEVKKEPAVKKEVKNKSNMKSDSSDSSSDEDDSSDEDTNEIESDSESD